VLRTEELEEAGIGLDDGEGQTCQPLVYSLSKPCCYQLSMCSDFMELEMVLVSSAPDSEVVRDHRQKLWSQIKCLIDLAYDIIRKSMWTKKCLTVLQEVESKSSPSSGVPQRSQRARDL
jgi:hypothetical protein